MIDELDLLILKTIAYSDQFKFPLLESEVYARLLKGKLNSVVSIKKFSLKLEKLVHSGFLIKQDNFFSLRGGESYINIRKKRNKNRSKKETEANNFIHVAKKITWIKAVVLTGSLAANNFNSSGDIDYLIITSRHRLWLTRIVVLLISWYRKKRPVLKQSVKDKWDFNMWLEEDNLAMPIDKRGVYDAYEVIQSKWLFDRTNIKDKFYSSNSWVGSLLLNWQVKKNYKVNNHLCKGNLILDWLNWLFYQLQCKYRLLRYGHQERLTRGSAFFHQNNSRQAIYKNWARSFAKIEGDL